MSEVLGLVWEDLDLDAGTARIRGGAVYTPSVGTVLGATKTSGAEGIHYLAHRGLPRIRCKKISYFTDGAKNFFTRCRRGTPAARRGWKAGRM